MVCENYIIIQKAISKKKKILIKINLKNYFFSKKNYLLIKSLISVRHKKLIMAD